MAYALQPPEGNEGLGTQPPVFSYLIKILSYLPNYGNVNRPTLPIEKKSMGHYSYQNLLQPNINLLLN